MTEQLIHPLVAQIMTANATTTSAMTEMVIDDLERRARRAEATLAVIREQVTRLHSSLWQPSQSSVIETLWPSDELVNAWMKTKEEC